MSSHDIPKRNATGAFATPIDPPQLRAHPRAHQQQDGNENLIDETAKMAKRLTEGPSQTQCVFGDEDIAPGTSIAGVSGRLGDPKLASMQKMVLDSVPEGSRVKIIYLITKEDGNNDLRAGTADNAAAAQGGPSEVGRFVRQNNAVQDRIRARVHQHGQGEDYEEEDEDMSPRPRKRRRASCRVSPLHMSPTGLKTEQEDEEEEEEEQIKEEADDEVKVEVDDEVKQEVDDEVKQEVDDEFEEEVDDEFKEEIDDEALFFAAPDEGINRSISSSHAMHRATLSLDSPHFDTRFLSSDRTAQQTNASDSNNDDGEDDGDESVQVRHTGDYFENFYNAYAAAFPSEDLPPYRRWDDLPLPRLR